ncbi:uncharacterized protein LOC144434412 [Glandiceps talaboti]
MAASTSTSMFSSGPLEGMFTEEEIFTDEYKEIASRDYPFENLVMEGGGAKGIAYAGVLKVLEKVGIWQKLKRYGGASAGAIVSCLLAVGYSPDEISTIIYNQNMEELAVDNPTKLGEYIHFIPHLKKLCSHYGWNSGNKLYDWLGKVIETKTGKKDLTFRELYMDHGRELCVIVTNVSLLTEEYYHVKTTPHESIRHAVRMSMSIPVFFEAVKSQSGEHQDLFVDGGVLDNYPIKCYDGWWLSMEIKDNFIAKLDLSDLDKIALRHDRFGRYNEKTLGVVLCAPCAEGVYDQRLVARDKDPTPRPDTPLARKQNEKDKRSRFPSDKKEEEILKAFSVLMKILKNCSLDRSLAIAKDDLKKALTDAAKDGTLSTEQGRLIFGPNWDPSSAVKELDFDKDGKITFDRLVKFAEERGLAAKSRFVGHARADIGNFREFLETFMNTLTVNIQRLYFKNNDLKRTIAVNIDYIGTLDFDMEAADKKFAIAQGTKAACGFLKEYLEKKDEAT